MVRSDLNRAVPLRVVFLSVLLALVAVSVDALGEEYKLLLDPHHTTVRFTLGDILHTVNGSFRLKEGEIQFNPATGTASGLLVVDVKSGDTGNKSRDRKMHKEILESAKYPDATFVPHFMCDNVRLPSPDFARSVRTFGDPSRSQVHEGNTVIRRCQ